MRGLLSRAYRADVSAVAQYELPDGERGEFRRAFVPVAAVLAAHQWALPKPVSVKPTRHSAFLSGLASE